MDYKKIMGNVFSDLMKDMDDIDGEKIIIIKNKKKYKDEDEKKKKSIKDLLSED